VVSLYIVVAEANTCAPWGGACPRTFFFSFSVVKEPFEGCQMQEEHMISLV